MPCNSDYMNPTADEIRRLGARTEELKEICDKIVYSADVQRELIIKCKADVHSLDVMEAIELTRRADESWKLVTEGNALVTKIKAEYAYNNKNKVVETFNKLTVQLAYVVDASNRVLKSNPVSDVDFERLENDQIHHRMEDVKRLIGVFTARSDFKTVAKLAQVDFTKELEPQIGFNADDY